MTSCLVLRLEAPLMSFGGPQVDQLGVSERMPTLSMLTGLIGSALGLSRKEPVALQTLQDRLVYAAREDRPGELLVDYQTVDLGQDFLQGTGWTTWGRPQERAGAFSKGTTIRYRTFLADAVYTVALCLVGDQNPSVDDIAVSLREPARPLFLGRKSCVPSTPILLNVVRQSSVIAALREVPTIREGETKRCRAWWPPDLSDAPEAGRIIELTDERDWANQIHGGKRRLAEGFLDLGGGGS